MWNNVPLLPNFIVLKNINVIYINVYLLLLNEL